VQVSGRDGGERCGAGEDGGEVRWPSEATCTPRGAWPGTNGSFSHSPRPGGEAKIALFEPVLEASQATKHASVAPSICEWRK